MGINELLEPGCVVSNVEARSKKHTLEILSELLAGGDHDILAGEIFDSLVRRERLGSTGLGEGVAIPHGRIENLKASVGAFLKLSEPIDFDAPDNAPVDLVFAILVPSDACDEHLHTLSAIAQRFREDNFAAQLREVSSSRELHERLVSEPPPVLEIPARNGEASHHLANGHLAQPRAGDPASADAETRPPDATDDQQQPGEPR